MRAEIVSCLIVDAAEQNLWYSLMFGFPRSCGDSSHPPVFAASSFVVGVLIRYSSVFVFIVGPMAFYCSPLTNGCPSVGEATTIDIGLGFGIERLTS